MTRIDFYVLPDGDRSDSVITACKLCDKATSAGSRVYVYTSDATAAAALDSALWSFRQGSFIAHERLGAEAAEPQPAVLIGGGEPPASHHGVMINLSLDVPAFFSRFERVLEIVQGDPNARARSRERYKFYRDRGYELATHNL